MKDDIILNPRAHSFKAGEQLHATSVHSIFPKHQLKCKMRPLARPQMETKRGTSWATSWETRETRPWEEGRAFQQRKTKRKTGWETRGETRWETSWRQGRQGLGKGDTPSNKGKQEGREAGRQAGRQDLGDKLPVKGDKASGWPTHIQQRKKEGRQAGRQGGKASGRRTHHPTKRGKKGDKLRQAKSQERQGLGKADTSSNKGPKKQAGRQAGGTRWETSWKTRATRATRPREGRHTFQQREEDKLGDKLGDKIGDKLGDKLENKLGDKLGDKQDKASGRPTKAQM